MVQLDIGSCVSRLGEGSLSSQVRTFKAYKLIPKYSFLLCMQHIFSAAGHLILWKKKLCA